MKRIAFALAALALSGGAIAGEGPAAPMDGQAFAQKNACLSCHSVDSKVYGPAFREVSKSYASDKEAAAKIAAFMRTGGKGKWGPAAMPSMAHVPESESKAIAEWIVSLEKPKDKEEAKPAAKAEPKAKAKPAAKSAAKPAAK